MKNLQWVGLLSAALMIGCATTGPGVRLTLPKGAEVVGGGLSVDWDSTREGTAMLVETTSGKVIRTESLKAGDRFSFNAVNDDSALILNRLFSEAHEGADSPQLLALPKNAQFVLYFVPAK